MKKLFLLLGTTLLAGPVWAGPSKIEQASQSAWELSGQGTKPIECYFWVVNREPSIVACHKLEHPTDEIALIVPANATAIYHTHPKGFPQLSEADKKSKIPIRVIYH
jgi:hypothetical protein